MSDDRGPRGRALGQGRSDRVGRRLPGGPDRRRAGGERGDPAGLARGWPKDRPARVDAATGEALKKLTIELTPAARAQLVRLVGPWGNQALDRLGAEIAASLLASVKDEQLSESRRIEAARQLIELRAADPSGANGCWN